jgi:MFS family permease
MKNLYLLGAISFFTDMASSMITTTFPLFLVFVLKNGVDKLGVVIGIATFVSYFFRVVFGYLSDRYGIKKPFLIVGYVISAISKPFFYFVTSWKGIAFLRSLDRFGKALRSAPKDSLLSDIKKEKGKVFGFHKMLDVAGEMSGALIAFLIFYILGTKEEVFREIFLLTLIPGIIAVILTFFLEDRKVAKKISFDIKEDKSLIFNLIFITFSLFFVLGDSFFIVKAKESVGILYVPLFLILMNFIQTVFSYPIGLIIEKIGFLKVFIFSLFSYLSAICFLKLNNLIFAFVFLGIFLVSFFNSIRVFISKKAKNRGTVFGMFYFLYALFGGIGSVVLGIIWQKFGFAVVYFYSFTGILFLIVINYFRIYRNKILEGN